MAQARIRKDMDVVVISGSDKSKRGKVLNVDNRKQRVIVEGVNTRQVSKRRSADMPNSGRSSKECPIHISNVMPAEQYDSSRAGSGKAAVAKQVKGEQ